MAHVIAVLYLLGFSLLPGKWGGCALVDGHALQCTYGSVAECTLPLRSSCLVPVYETRVENEAEARKVIDRLLESGDMPTVLGPWKDALTAPEITARFTSGIDARGAK